MKLLGRQRKWLAANSFSDRAATDALRANFHRLGRTVALSSSNLLQVRSELTARNTGLLGTYSAQILRLTASLDRVTLLGSFSTNFTNACHDST